MIKYDKLWDTMKQKNISQYNLYERYGISRSLLDRLRKNENVQTYTIGRLCSILECKVEDIMTYVPDDDNTEQ